MACMNSGVSAYREDAVVRQDAAESQPVSDMGNVPSKYHDASGVPFPGPDALALAAGTLERPSTPAHDAVNQAKQSTAAAVDPTGALLVTHGHERLCINCRWCTDWDVPTPPAFLACTRPIISAAAKGTPPCCVTARSTHYGHLACGEQAEWFTDAIEPDWHRDFGPE